MYYCISVDFLAKHLMELKHNENDGNEPNVNQLSEVKPVVSNNKRNQPQKVRQSRRIRKKPVKIGG